MAPGQTVSRIVTITNTGGTTLDISSITPSVLEEQSSLNRYSAAVQQGVG